MISVVQKRKSTPGVGRQQNTAMGAVTAAAATGNNQNKRAPQQAKKKTKSSSNNKKCAQNQQQHQQQPQMVQMNNQNNQANDEQVWIFGLINNIEQLLATCNSVNNQSSLQQQQQQQHLSFSNKSPPSGYSTPSTMSSPFILSSSSCSSNSSAQSTSNSPVCSPKVSQLSSSSLYANSSNQASLFGSPGPGQQQQQQVLGLHQSNITTTTNTNHQQQLPRSPISRQIKFHEYKGPPQVKRPANHSNQKQSNGSISQKAPASSSLSSSATSNTSSGVQGNAGNSMATNQAPLAVRGQSGGDCNNNNNQRADCVQVLDVNSLENVKQMSSISHQQQQQTPTTLCLNKMTSPSGNNQLIPSQTMIQGPQQPALFRVVPAAPAEGVQVISSSHQQQEQQRQQTIFVSPTSEMLNCGQQQQFVVLQEQPQQQQEQQYQPHLASSDFTYSAPNQFGQQATFAYGAPGDELAMTEPTQQFASPVASTLGHDESSDQFVDNFSLMGQMEPSDQDHNDDDDTCDIEPTICFSNGQSGANYDETLLFSEYIDMQDIPMNVDESDWLKKFLPPCSMS